MSALTLTLMTPEQTNTIAALAASVVAIVAAAKVLTPLMRALARRIEGSWRAEATRDELDELRHRVAELEARDLRLFEVEERLDFAERLLQQRALEPRADTPPEASPAGR
jgi:hypothetical protein